MSNCQKWFTLKVLLAILPSQTAFRYCLEDFSYNVQEPCSTMVYHLPCSSVRICTGGEMSPFPFELKARILKLYSV